MHGQYSYRTDFKILLKFNCLNLNKYMYLDATMLDREALYSI